MVSIHFVDYFRNVVLDLLCDFLGGKPPNYTLGIFCDAFQYMLQWVFHGFPLDVNNKLSLLPIS